MTKFYDDDFYADQNNYDLPLIPSTQVDVTPWRCTACGKAVGKLYRDDDGREYRDCDCTKAARERKEKNDG